MSKILWVEDEADGGLVRLRGPVEGLAVYDLRIARNATEAVQELLQDKYDAVVVDIRIPPGDDTRWISQYEKYGANPRAARLGIALLHSLLRPDKAEVTLHESIPDWIRANPARFGVLTDEGVKEVEDDKVALGILVCIHKPPRPPRTLLLDAIQEILAKASHSK